MSTMKNWRRHLRGTANRFVKDEKGNVAVMTAATLIGVTLFTGGSLDIYTLEMERKRIQGVIDRCALQTSRVGHDQADGAGEAGRDQMRQMFRDCADAQGVAIPANAVITPVNNPDQGLRSLNVSFTQTVPTKFLNLASISKFDLSMETAAEEQLTTVEVSLVLDMSGSMATYTSGNTRRIDELKSAASVFVDALLPGPEQQKFTSINLVPYSGNVSMGRGMFDIVRSGDRDHDRSSCIYFRNSDYGAAGLPNFRSRDHVEHYSAGFSHHNWYDYTFAQNDPPWYELNDPGGPGSRYQDFGYYTPKNSARANFEDADIRKPLMRDPWDCPDDPHAYLLRPIQTITNPDQVPLTLDGQPIDLHRDLEDHITTCERTSLYFYHTQSRPGYNTGWRVRRDDRGDEMTTCEWNPDEPERATMTLKEVLDAGYVGIDNDRTEIMYAASDPDAIKDRIDRLKLSGFTATQVGMKWGEMLLNPDFQAHFDAARNSGVIDMRADQAGRPFEYDRGGNFKYIVLMTDGRTTPLYENSGTPYHYDRSTNRRSQRVSRGTAIQQFRTTCALAKSQAKNIRVYTIGFALRDGQDDDIKNELRNCASQPSSAHYFDVGAGNLEAAFRKIAASINTLKLVSN